MINTIKTLISPSLKQKLKNFYPFNRSLQYSNFQHNVDQLNLSDFFLFRNDKLDTVFIAENSLALLTSNPINCIHKFYFYDQNGSNCGQYEAVSNSFHYKLIINSEMTGDNSIGGFIHQTEYSKEILDQNPDISLKKLIFHHRGYSGFRRKDSDFNFYSFLHGNFGGMYMNKGEITSISKQRSKHFYSPPIIIKSDKTYELFFLNPTHKKLKISIFLIDKHNEFRNIGNIDINPLGSSRFDINNSSNREIENISWKTNLPIGRAIVFENNGALFDVFHS
jgi:hypothetical protein